MLERILEEAPRFFNYYNMIFLLKAMLTTFALSAIGCLVGFVIGFFLVICRRTRMGIVPYSSSRYVICGIFS